MQLPPWFFPATRITHRLRKEGYKVDVSTQGYFLADHPLLLYKVTKDGEKIVEYQQNLYGFRQMSHCSDERASEIIQSVRGRKDG